MRWRVGVPDWTTVPPSRYSIADGIVRRLSSTGLVRDVSAPIGDGAAPKWFERSLLGTDLDKVLHGIGARRIIVTGLQSELCVAATCRGALRLGYEVRLAQDGHSTWRDGRSASEIIASENEALAAEGVVLRRIARSLVERGPENEHALNAAVCSRCGR